MGTSKSYLPKVTKNTTKTKLSITNAIKSGHQEDKKSLSKIVNSFKSSLIKDSSGLKNSNYIRVISRIGGIIAAISSSGISEYVNLQFDDTQKIIIHSPQDLFNNIIRKEDYLTEFEKANVLDAVSSTIEQMHINNIEDLELTNCDTFFKMFLLNLIYSLFLSSYYEYIDSKINSPKETQDFCCEIREYIEGRLLSENTLIIELMNNQSMMNEYVKNIIDDVLSLL